MKKLKYVCMLAMFIYCAKIHSMEEKKGRLDDFYENSQEVGNMLLSMDAQDAEKKKNEYLKELDIIIKDDLAIPEEKKKARQLVACLQKLKFAEDVF